MTIQPSEQLDAIADTMPCGMTHTGDIARWIKARFPNVHRKDREALIILYRERERGRESRSLQTASPEALLEIVTKQRKQIVALEATVAVLQKRIAGRKKSPKGQKRKTRIRGGKPKYRQWIRIVSGGLPSLGKR